MLVFIAKIVKAAVVMALFLATFVLGWLASYHSTSIWHSSQAMCYVEGAVVVACQRNEDGEFYVWKVAAIRNEGALGEEIIVIQHRIRKVRFQYAF